MKITAIDTTPLLIPYSRPYHWAQGAVAGACVIFVEVHTDAGLVGYGESIGSPCAEAVKAYIDRAARLCIGSNPFSNARLMANAHRLLFRASGTSSAPRFSGQVLSGLEMALWDLMGKATDKPVHALLGGAVREDVSYFGFAQGATADEVAADALVLSNDGFEVIYVKAGRGDTEDLRTVAAVRDAIGVDKRIRVDPNEQWKPGQALRMIRKLLPFDVEYIEQPTHAESISSLAQVHSASPIAISADQSVFTPFDAFEICRQRAADLLVVGLHETGGLLRLSKVAHVAEAAGLDVCLHSLFETGISTCAANQVAATIPNLDDANQHMTRFLAWDLVKSPDLRPRGGKLSVSQDAGLGFQMDWDGVERAKKCYSELKDRIDFSQGVPN